MLLSHDKGGRSPEQAAASLKATQKLLIAMGLMRAPEWTAGPRRGPGRKTWPRKTYLGTGPGAQRAAARLAARRDFLDRWYRPGAMARIPTRNGRRWPEGAAPC